MLEEKQYWQAGKERRISNRVAVAPIRATRVGAQWSRCVGVINSTAHLVHSDAVVAVIDLCTKGTTIRVHFQLAFSSTDWISLAMGATQAQQGTTGVVASAWTVRNGTRRSTDALKTPWNLGQKKEQRDTHDWLTRRTRGRKVNEKTQMSTIWWRGWPALYAVSHRKTCGATHPCSCSICILLSGKAALPAVMCNNSLDT